MYKLLFVEDNEEVRRRIIQKVPWDQLGFEVAGEAANGEEALELAERILPDLVITDIKMPFMDGLELVRCLNMKSPSPKVIIVTGFDEFEYAKQAVKLGVVEYVLKPVSSKELIEVIKKVKAQIDEEITQREDINLLKEHFKKSLPVLREKFFESLITSKLDINEIQSKTKAYNIELNGNRFMVSVISPDCSFSDNGQQSCLSSTGTKSRFFNAQEDWELLRFAVFNIANEIAARYDIKIVFFHRDCIIVITACSLKNEQAAINHTLSIMEEIKQSVEKYLKITVSIGVGTLHHNIYEIKESYDNAILALDYRLILGCNRVIFIGDIESPNRQKIVFDEDKERTLSTGIRVGSAREIIQIMDSLFAEIIQTKATFKDYQIYILEILTSILKTAKSLNIDTDNIFGPNYNFFIEIYKFKNIVNVKNWLCNICTRIMDHISVERQDTCDLIVARAKEYIRLNYHCSDISINKVCSYLHISPSYFSSIFKKKTKETFISYLAKCRMEAAKELLRITDMKTFEIAKKVGYAEPNYFSYCFKKHFGMSPTEYRNNG